MSGDDRIPVAQIVDRWLNLTETFIHEYVSAAERTRPVIVARSTDNLGLFPLPPDATLELSPPARGSLAWWRGAIERRRRGEDPHRIRVLRRHGVRVLHAHFGPVACEWLEARGRADLPLVTSFYGYDATRSDVVNAHRARYARLFAEGSAFLAEGPAMRDKLIALGCPASKVLVQPIAIDVEAYEHRIPTPPDDGPATLLMCGRMVPKKGFPCAIEALAIARRRGTALRLRILGDGPDREAVEQLVEARGLRDDVEFLGARPRDAFRKELARAHGYLQPSVRAPDGDSEGGAPTALLEAQASGLPILATRHDDIPAVVSDGDGAWLCDPGDAEGFAELLMRFAASPDRWSAMSAAGRAFVERRHDVRRLAPRLESLYASLAEHGRIEAVPEAPE